MIKRLKSHTLPLLILFFVLVYMTFGFAYTGIIVLPSLEPITFGVFVLGAIFAGLQHLRGHWRFYNTPLTAMVAFWMFAIAASFVTNPHIWRVSLEAIWYVGLLIGVMGFFTGALTNGTLTRQIVEEVFLLLGVVLVAIGYAQLITIVGQGREVPLLASLIGSPNYYAMLLVIIAILALHRAITSHLLVVRLGMGLYVLAVLIQLWLTGSRGGQIGFVVAICTYGGLWLMSAPKPGESTPYSRLDTVLRQRIGIRLIWLVILGIIFVAVAVAIIALSGSLSNRFGVFSVAIDLFLQKPLTGNGLFSYGESGMALLTTPHRMIAAHAHSVVLNVMAELGLLGVVALGYSIIAGIRTIIANRRILQLPDLRNYDALVAVLVGLSVHHLIDLALLYVALLVFIIITLVITPVAPKPVTQPTIRRGLSLSLVLLFLGLLLGAMWYMPIVTHYEAVLKEIRQKQVGYPELIQQLQALIDLDPENRTYRLQVAVLAGEYAYQTNDADDIEAAVQLHQEALKLMPHLSVGWSNLASLYWQSGDMDSASDAAATAVLYADDWPLPQWQYWAYRHSQRIPWSIKPRRTAFRDSLIFVYMHDISEPIVLAQSTASFTMTPEEIWLTLFRKLRAIEFSAR